jgi:hypothetical protein
MLLVGSGVWAMAAAGRRRARFASVGGEAMGTVRALRGLRRAGYSRSTPKRSQ